MARGVMKMNEDKILVFILVDNEGNIIEMLKGARVIPDIEYNFLFIRSREEAEMIKMNEYKVEMNGFKAVLVKK